MTSTTQTFSAGDTVLHRRDRRVGTVLQAEDNEYGYTQVLVQWGENTMDSGWHEAPLLVPITITNKTRTTRPRVAGKRAVSTDLTEIREDGEIVRTIIWTGPLLRRLEQDGTTREDYIAKLIARP